MSKLAIGGEALVDRPGEIIEICAPLCSPTCEPDCRYRPKHQYRTAKAAVKIHLLLGHDGLLPEFDPANSLSSKGPWSSLIAATAITIRHPFKGQRVLDFG